MPKKLKKPKIDYRPAWKAIQAWIEYVPPDGGYCGRRKVEWSSEQIVLYWGGVPERSNTVSALFITYANRKPFPCLFSAAQWATKHLDGKLRASPKGEV